MERKILLPLGVARQRRLIRGIKRVESEVGVPFPLPEAGCPSRVLASLLAFTLHAPLPFPRQSHPQSSPEKALSQKKELCLDETGLPPPAPSTMGRRRLSLPPTLLSTPLQAMYGGAGHPLRQRASQPSLLFLHSSPQLQRHHNNSMGALNRPRLSQPDLYHPIPSNGYTSPAVRAFYTPPHSAYFEPMPVPYPGRVRTLPSAPPMPRSAQLPRRYLKRANQSDLSVRFQRNSEMTARSEDSPARGSLVPFSAIHEHLTGSIIRGHDRRTKESRG